MRDGIPAGRSALLKRGGPMTHGVPADGRVAAQAIGSLQDTGWMATSEAGIIVRT